MRKVTTIGIIVCTLIIVGAMFACIIFSTSNPIAWKLRHTLSTSDRSFYRNVLFTTYEIMTQYQESNGYLPMLSDEAFARGFVPPISGTPKPPDL